MHYIPIESCDATFDQDCSGDIKFPYLRAKYDKSTGQGLNNPREQLNEKTSWIDASIVYNVQEPWVNALRSFRNGTLREGPVQGYPPLNAERLPLINPPPPQAEHPDWTDDQLFSRARRYVIAVLQNIIMYEFLPALLDEPTASYAGYNPHLPPGISNEFAAAAFRYPHTMVPSGTFLRDGKCHFENNVGGYPALRLCNTWWNAQDDLQRYSMDEFILGMASQIAEKEDRIIVSDLRDYVFGPLHFSRRDLTALTIMRGRDHGLPDYNTAREFFGLPRVADFKGINPMHYREDPAVRKFIEFKFYHFYKNLSKLYDGNIEKLDIYIGGILEFSNGTPGQLFKRIIREQFYRLRDADRFWFENIKNGYLILSVVFDG
ncbi:unnamed protein product [Soboliphyme baturini]|uniref:NAD(P)H oxidase (H(2)O(2)-forming) n=1 Tax=Soboliphyme baturini TaxID=241478 RepID=A0A183J973_9BILA|nr:unnamed protein product [Soboliphyme baturini]